MTVLSVPAAAQFSAVAVAVYSVVPSVFSWSTMGIDDQDDLDGSNHTGDFPRGVGHRVRGVAASRFVGRQELVAYKGLVLTLGSMITIPMVWSM